MACALGIEQDCGECRMCGNGKGGKEVTNFDWIKGMSVEELSEFLRKVNIKVVPCIARGGVYDDCPIEHKKCKDCFKKWLESECDAE